jgi:hypothetical protein
VCVPVRLPRTVRLSDDDDDDEGDEGDVIARRVERILVSSLRELCDARGSGMEEAPEIHGARRRAGLARSVLKALARTFLGLAHYATTDDYETALEATQELYYGGCDF